jgi:hypothetical protein
MTKEQADHIKWLKFAILLSQARFEDLTEGQRLDLKNKYREFLDSMPKPKVLGMLRGSEIVTSTPETTIKKMMAFLGEDDVDEKRAQEILKPELRNLAEASIKRHDASFFTPNTSACFGIGKEKDSFYFVVIPQKADKRILALLGYHLAGSSIPASFLRRCPQCGAIFLADRKPRLDRDLHCSSHCSSKASSLRYQERNRVLSRAIKLFRDGKPIDHILRFLKLNRESDRYWLERHLGLKKKSPKRDEKLNLVK